MISPLLLACLVALGAAEAPGQDTAAPPVVRAAAADLTAATLARFERALAEWQAKLGATEDRAERRKLKRTHPAEAFAAELQVLAEGGHGPAAKWCLKYLSDLGLRRKQREALRLELYAVLIDATDGPLRDWTLEQLIGDAHLKRAIGNEGLGALVERYTARETDALRIGHARALFGRSLYNSRDDAESGRGLALLRSVAGAEAALDEVDRKWVEELLFAADFLSVGKLAPAFEGHSVDGERLSLESFRGKVTVLSFFGFW